MILRFLAGTMGQTVIPPFTEGGDNGRGAGQERRDSDPPRRHSPHFMDKEDEIWKHEMIDLDHFSSYFHSVQRKYIL